MIAGRDDAAFKVVGGGLFTPAQAETVGLGAVHGVGDRLGRLAEGDGGAPRKYYILTIQGRQLLGGMIPSWSKLAASVDRLLPGESA